MPFLLGGAATLLLLLLLLRGFATASPAAVRGVLAWTAAGLGAALLLLLVLGGRLGQVFWALGLFGPLLWRWWQGRRAARRFARGPGGDVSRVETATLAMTLDHASGRMTGLVRRGRFAGRDLADLDLAALLALLADCAGADPESVPLLEAWLDRAVPDWRAAAGEGAARGEADGKADGPSGAAASAGNPSRAEALALLGLAEGATPAEIRAAHRRLMAANHPDRGGDPALAARLNRARDVLLGR
ncbi:hypothetical protein M0638_03850 [Roseomonas sp. NAR14]|uniref:J domain-containing protein n=1 Tax=Roseomonas acroporae TaxID=2937791 RepID=A0A9X1Y7A6_9PROT|nr:hypothetical protein [Roseomonas acroporae]MCK8783515.1 hypothetical protein [Roseomonas acroporae]